MTTTIAEQTRLLRLPAVIELTGLKRDAIYRGIRNGSFPMPRKITGRASAWRSDELQAWIDARPTAAPPRSA